MIYRLTTQRLTLRQWQASDAEPFAALNGDPQVMRYFPACLSRAQSDDAMKRYQAGIEDRGWGFFAVEYQQQFIGFVGMQPIKPSIPVAPGVEIGWRLARHAWHQGFASEAARACLALAFDKLKLDDVKAFTAVTNIPSQKVMQRIGMARCPNEFVHPNVPAGHLLSQHRVYRISADQWLAQRD